MKNLNLILLITLSFFYNFTHAQEDIKKSKFDIITYAGIGNGIITNDTEPNYNVNSNFGEILLNYKFKENYGLSTGLGYNQLNGTGFNSNGNFYHERTVLKIPLLFNFQYNIDEKIKLISNLGFYTQTITKDEYRFLVSSENDVYSGWNFGSQLSLGFAYQLNSYMSLGVNFNGQSDFSKFKTTSGASIEDKQKIKNLNSLGLIFVFKI